MLKNLFVAIVQVIACLCFPESVDESIPEFLCSEKKCYTILDVLGEGAFGKVYSAKDASEALYAIKCYKKNSMGAYFFSDPKREFEIGQQLDHPNIIKTYDYFSAAYKGELTDYLVIQYVDGSPLSNYPKRCMGREESLKAFASLVSALIHALSQDRLYLDLHSNNLMLNKNYELMVIDLASFFTFDEIYTYFQTKITESSARDVHNAQMFKNAKIEQFFSENPQLFQKMEFLHKKNAGIASEDEGRIKDAIILYLLTDYFNRITDTCVALVLKSDIERNERIALRTKLKNVAWAYEEDVDEGIDLPISHYIEQLAALHSSLYQD